MEESGFFGGTDGFLCQVQYTRCSNAGVLLVPVVFVSAFRIFHSERLAFITTTSFLRGPVVDGLHCFLTSTPAQQRPLPTPILTFSRCSVANTFDPKASLLFQRHLDPPCC